MVPHFIKAVFLWHKLLRWSKTCKDPLKLGLIHIVLRGTRMSLTQIGWWIPKYDDPLDDVDHLMKISNFQKYRQAAYLERKRSE